MVSKTARSNLNRSRNLQTLTTARPPRQRHRAQHQYRALAQIHPSIPHCRNAVNDGTAVHLDNIQTRGRCGFVRVSASSIDTNFNYFSLRHCMVPDLSGRSSALRQTIGGPGLAPFERGGRPLHVFLIASPRNCGEPHPTLSLPRRGCHRYLPAS